MKPSRAKSVRVAVVEGAAATVVAAEAAEVAVVAAVTVGAVAAETAGKPASRLYAGLLKGHPEEGCISAMQPSSCGLVEPQSVSVKWAISGLQRNRNGSPTFPMPRFTYRRVFPTVNQPSR